MKIFGQLQKCPYPFNFKSAAIFGTVSNVDLHATHEGETIFTLLMSPPPIGKTGYGRYKINILHHISLMKKLLHSILGVPLAHYVYYNLKHTKHENIN